MFTHARADAVFLTSRQVRCSPAAKGRWPSFSMPIRIRTITGAAPRRRPRPTMMTRKSGPILSRWVFNTCSTEAGASKGNCHTIFAISRPRDEAGNLVSANWSQVGDARLEGLYTGFFADMSAGATFGVKLPTGSYTFAPEVVDRDSQLGTGSTDVLLGGFYRGSLTRTTSGIGSRNCNWTCPL